MRRGRSLPFAVALISLLATSAAQAAGRDAPVNLDPVRDALLRPFGFAAAS